MTFDQIRYFHAVSMYGHLGNAAKSIPISPSAVSTAIAGLEEELGCLLFERRGKKLLLTDQGKLLKVESQVLIDHVARIRTSLKSKSSQLDGQFRLGGSPFLAVNLLAPAWSKLQLRHPKLVGELRSLPTAQIVLEISSGRMDGGLVFSVPRQVDLRREELYIGQLQIAVGKKHPLLKMKRPWTNLNQYPACFHQASLGVDLCQAHPELEKHGIRPEVHLTFDSDELAIANLKDGRSWAMLPDLVIQKYSQFVSALPLPEKWNAPYDVSWISREERSEISPWSSLKGLIAPMFKP